MATGVYGNIAVEIDLSLTKPNVGASQPKHEAILNFLMHFDQGNAALGKADVLYHAVRQTAASTTDSLDISGTVLDPLGGNVVNAEICAIAIKTDPTNVNNVIVGPAAANGFLGPWSALTDRTKIEPGNFFLVTSVNGWIVTAATADLIALINSGAGTPVNYEILIVGRTIVG